MSFVGKFAWKVVIQTEGLSEIRHNAGCGELSCFLDMQIHSLWFGWESWVSVSPHDEIVCLFICMGFSTLKILSIIIIIDVVVVSQKVCPLLWSATAFRSLCAHLQLRTLLPCLYLVCFAFPILKSSSSFQAFRKNIIKECCEHFWGCPVQRQEVDSVILVGNFHKKCCCDSNVI